MSFKEDYGNEYSEICIKYIVHSNRSNQSLAYYTKSQHLQILSFHNNSFVPFRIRKKLATGKIFLKDENCWSNYNIIYVLIQLASFKEMGLRCFLIILFVAQAGDAEINNIPECSNSFIAG